VSIVLMAVPGAPVMDTVTQEQVRDCGFRDPSGNRVRLTQLADVGALN
jgi:hypothetical protein